MMEISGFSKFAVRGPGARDWLDRMLACRLPKPGRMTLAPMLKHDGRLIGDEAIWLDGEVVGWVTSGGYAHNARLSMAIWPWATCRGSWPRRKALVRGTPWRTPPRPATTRAHLGRQRREDARLTEV